MTSPNAQHLRDEIIVLLEQQLHVLEKQTFGVATESEILDYEYRAECIHRLYDQLLEKRSVAA